MKMKLLRHFVSLIAVCFALLALAGCKASTTSLVGTYSVEDQGKMRVFLRIEKSGEKFLFIERDGRKWLAPAEAEEVDDTDLERILGQTIPSGFVGVGNDSMAVLSVHKGWKLGAFESKTGYILASQLGPIDLYKQ